MINIKDIQIGDWVMTEVGMMRVAQIFKNHIDCDVPTGSKTWEITMIEPIPLTPEILDKNGFVYNELPFVQGWEQFGLTLHRGSNGYHIGCGINVSLIIDYVHQLQHAIRLCGIEKEIKI